MNREIYNLDFDGLSGRIIFNNLTGSVLRNVTIKQLSKKQLIPIAEYWHEDGITELNQTGVFLDSEITIRERIFSPPSPLPFAILILIATSIGLVMLISLQILTIVYRDSKTVKASSPRLNHFAFFGCYLLVVSLTLDVCIETFPNYYDAGIRCYLVHFRDGCQFVGLTLIQSIICVKTWRLYRIFVFTKTLESVYLIAHCQSQFFSAYSLLSLYRLDG